jgi:hypothetical protein
VRGPSRRRASYAGSPPSTGRWARIVLTLFMPSLLIATFGAPAVTGAVSSHWTIEQTQSAVPGHFVTLGSVQCVSSTVCIALGNAAAYPADVRSFSERRQSGSWQVIPTATLPGRNTQLYGLSCSSATSCIAVGSQFKGTLAHPGLYSPLAERWNGATWSVIPTAAHPPRDAGLQAIWCGRATCIADGSTEVNYPSPFAEVLRAGAWHMTSKQGKDFQPDGIDCTSSSNCIEVGVNGVGRCGSDGCPNSSFAKLWNGHSWRSLPSPRGPRGYQSMYGVSCPRAHECIAVGSGKTAAAIWNGHVWRTSATPHTSAVRYGTTLSGVACTSRFSCQAVGDTPSHRGSSGAYPVAEHWNGHAWSVERTAIPHAYRTTLDSVSCPSTGFCSSVGYFLPQLGQYEATTLAEVL